MASGVRLRVSGLILWVVCSVWGEWVQPHYWPHQFVDLELEYMEYIAGLVDTDKLMKELYMPIQIPRVVGTEGHSKVQSFIKDHFDRIGGWRLDVDTFESNTPLGVKTFSNLIFTLDPYASRRLVLAAHYDSKYFAQGRFVGATDSAMPCAMLLHMAEILSPVLKNYTFAESKPHDLTIQMIFFDGEEAFENWSADDSIYGARHLATVFSDSHVPLRPKDMDTETVSGGHQQFSARREDEVPSSITQLQAIDAFVLIDLIGHRDFQIPWMHKATGHIFGKLVSLERVLDLAELLDGHTGKKRYFRKGTYPEEYGIGDDHSPFEHLNVPIVHLIPFPFPPFWHKIGDDMSVIDRKTSGNIIKILSVFVCEYLHLTKQE